MTLTSLLLFCGGLFLLRTVHAAVTVASTVSSNLPTSQGAEYVCFFASLWTPADHPIDFPGRAGFSQPLIVVHSSEYDLFEEGTVASEGMQALAETGTIVDVVNEIFAVNGEEDDIVVDTVVGMEVELSSSPPRQTLRGLQVDDMHAMVSAAAKIAPSPDWFTGFSAFDPRDSTTNTWYYEFSLQTPPYDAGTQEGETYEQALGESSPAEPIVEITSSNAPTSGAFLNPTGDAVLPVADWSCRLVNGQAATPGTPPATAPIPTLSPVAEPSNNELTNTTTTAPTATLSTTAPPILLPTSMAPSVVPSTQPVTAGPIAANATTTDPLVAPTAMPVATVLSTTAPTPTPTGTPPSTADPIAGATAQPTPAPVITELSDTPSSSPTSSSSPTETTAVPAPSDQEVQITSMPTLSPVAAVPESPPPTTPSPMAPVVTTESVTTVVDGIKLTLVNALPLPTALLDEWQGVTDAWFDGYYARHTGQVSVENMVGVVSFMSQEGFMDDDGISPINVITYNHQLSYDVPPLPTQPDPQILAVLPYGVEAANAEYAALLQRRFPSVFGNLQTPIAIPKVAESNIMPTAAPASTQTAAPSVSQNTTTTAAPAGTQTAAPSVSQNTTTTAAPAGTQTAAPSVYPPTSTVDGDATASAPDPPTTTTPQLATAAPVPGAQETEPTPINDGDDVNETIVPSPSDAPSDRPSMQPSIVPTIVSTNDTDRGQVAGLDSMSAPVHLTWVAMLPTVAVVMTMLF